MKKQDNYYVLMADIQKSSQYRGGDLMAEFAALVKEVNQAEKASLLSPLTITLGDEFQSVVRDLPAGMGIMIRLEEALLARQFPFKLRYVLHYGSIETPINPEIAYGMLGPGLTFARESLDQLKTRRGERFFLQTDAPQKDAVLNKLFFLYSSLVDDWKPAEAETITLFLQHPDYKVVADIQQKDRSLLWRREKSLRLREYHTIRELIFLSGASPA